MRRCYLTFALFFLAVLPMPAQAQDVDFFFYSPQVGPENLSLLKETADAYFREQDLKIRFQPFARFEDLETEATRRHPHFILVPRWVFTTRCLDDRLVPLARPIRDGRMIDRRALVAGRTVVTTAQLDGGSIAATLPASAAMHGGSEALARFRDDHPTVRVIPVPKDVDALLAVGFGQVDAAFVSLAQFEMLSRVNPALTAGLHELGYSDEIPFPQVYATGYAAPETIARMQDALERTIRSDAGKRLSSLLGFDQWVRIQSSEADATSGSRPETCGGLRP